MEANAVEAVSSQAHLAYPTVENSSDYVTSSQISYPAQDERVVYASGSSQTPLEGHVFANGPEFVISSHTNYSVQQRNVICAAVSSQHEPLEQQPVVDNASITVGVESNKTPPPKPKRKKHRPKVVREGKPARVTKPRTSPSVPKENGEKPPKRKYVRKKPLNSIPDGSAVEAAASNGEAVTKPVRRSINFSAEGSRTNEYPSSLLLSCTKGNQLGKAAVNDHVGPESSLRNIDFQIAQTSSMGNNTCLLNFSNSNHDASALDYQVGNIVAYEYAGPSSAVTEAGLYHAYEASHGIIVNGRTFASDPPAEINTGTNKYDAPSSVFPGVGNSHASDPLSVTSTRSNECAGLSSIIPRAGNSHAYDTSHCGIVNSTRFAAYSPTSAKANDFSGPSSVSRAVNSHAHENSDSGISNCLTFTSDPSVTGTISNECGRLASIIPGAVNSASYDASQCGAVDYSQIASYYPTASSGANEFAGPSSEFQAGNSHAHEASHSRTIRYPTIASDECPGPSSAIPRAGNSDANYASHCGIVNRPPLVSCYPTTSTRANEFAGTSSVSRAGTPHAHEASHSRIVNRSAFASNPLSATSTGNNGCARPSSVNARAGNSPAYGTSHCGIVNRPPYAAYASIASARARFSNRGTHVPVSRCYPNSLSQATPQQRINTGPVLNSAHQGSNGQMLGSSSAPRGLIFDLNHPVDQMQNDSISCSDGQGLRTNTGHSSELLTDAERMLAGQNSQCSDPRIAFLRNEAVRSARVQNMLKRSVHTQNISSLDKTSRESQHATTEKQSGCISQKCTDMAISTGVPPQGAVSLKTILFWMQHQRNGTIPLLKNSRDASAVSAPSTDPLVFSRADAQRLSACQSSHCSDQRAAIHMRASVPSAHAQNMPNPSVHAQNFSPLDEISRVGHHATAEKQFGAIIRKRAEDAISTDLPPQKKGRKNDTVDLQITKKSPDGNSSEKPKAKRRSKKEKELQVNPASVNSALIASANEFVGNTVTSFLPGPCDKIPSKQPTSGRMNFANSSRTASSNHYTIEILIQQMRRLSLNDIKENFAAESSTAVVPYVGGSGTIVPYGGPLEKKRRSRAKVDLDPVSTIMWNFLMGKEADGSEGLDKDKEKMLEEERAIFRGRVDSFIARMHLIQGDRRFSRWKGSVVDSVVGVFLTQNVSDHLSSSAFMALAAKFPAKPILREASAEAPNCAPKAQDNTALGMYGSISRWPARFSIEEISDQVSLVTSDEKEGSNSNGYFESSSGDIGINIFAGMHSRYESKKNSASPDSVETAVITSTGTAVAAEPEDRSAENVASISPQNSAVSSQGSLDYLSQTNDLAGSSSSSNCVTDDFATTSLSYIMDGSGSYTELIRRAESNGQNCERISQAYVGAGLYSKSSVGERTEVINQPIDCSFPYAEKNNNLQDGHATNSVNESPAQQNGFAENANGEKSKKPKREPAKRKSFDWDSLRKEVSERVPEERSFDTLDTIDWEAVRSADVRVISDTIKERGMNNMLAERIKDFLNRLVNDHGSIDLEWLRHVDPAKAKEYLLSIRGLGLKSVECVRLLTLHHMAFPVDTNVGRICVRLGWVPIQPLPESLQLHLLELYPIQENIQKYIWPRISDLDRLRLYELHYQMITFGKVFCTKSKPNCNACPMRAECKHFASAYASARLALPGPEEKRLAVATATTLPEAAPMPAPQNFSEYVKARPAGQLVWSTSEQQRSLQIREPIVEMPASPEPQPEPDPEDLAIEDAACVEDPDEIPVIKLNLDQFTQNLKNYIEANNIEIEEADMSKALVAITSEAASLPTPKLKNVNRLRTEHQVYELPDGHQLLAGLERREPDDPCPYLLSIWTPGETAQSTDAPTACCNSAENGQLCDKIQCFKCSSIREAQAQKVRATILIPCRTAMRGSFPLNGTYFQVNEVFADHYTSQYPIDVPRSWIWKLPRRTVYFGTSIPTIFKGLTMEEIQQCFWRGFVCVRGFDRATRAPRPLYPRLHFPASKVTRVKRTAEPPTPAAMATAPAAGVATATDE